MLLCKGMECVKRVNGEKGGVFDVRCVGWC